MTATPPLGPAALADWCLTHLGSAPARRLFEHRHLSRVLGVTLADGREVVVKARPDHPRLHGCHRVQQHLAANGFPCPAPLTPPVRVGTLAVSAETYRPGGQVVAFADADPRLSAAALARLVAAAADLPAGLDLHPSPPWVSPEPAGAPLWPRPDDVGGDLNDPRFAGWLDDIARAARDRIAHHRGPRVYGHGDWYAANIACRGGRVCAVHDWDSVVCEPEPVIAGVAAAIFPGTGTPGEVASIEQSAAFLAAYADARQRHWTPDERQVCWAASVWTRAFDAKKELLRGGAVRALTRGEASERLRLAGLRG